MNEFSLHIANESRLNGFDSVLAILDPFIIVDLDVVKFFFAFFTFLALIFLSLSSLDFSSSMTIHDDYAFSSLSNVRMRLKLNVTQNNR